MTQKRWSVLVIGYSLILVVAVLLGALTLPSPALAENSGGTLPPPACPDTTTGGSSIGDPIIDEPVPTEPSTVDLLLMTIDFLMVW